MLFYLFQIIVRDIVHLGPLSRFADRKVVLGAMAAALGATAARFPTTLVALDDGATQYGGQVGQVPHERFLPSPQGSCRFVSHVHPTSYRTGLKLSESGSLVNSFFCIIKAVDKIFQSTEAIKIQEGIFLGFLRFLIGPLLRNRKGAHRGSKQDQGIDSRYPSRFQNSKTLSTKRMKGMGDLRPSQRCAAMMCF